MITRLLHLESVVLGWFHRPAPVDTLSLIRIGLGLVLVLSVVQVLPDVDWLWGPDGLLRYLLARYQDHPLSNYTWTVVTLLLVSSVLFTVGCFTRLAGVTAAVMQAVVASSEYYHTWGWVSVMPPLVFILAMSPARNAWSVDAWLARRRGRPLPAEAPQWALRLLQVHIAAIYIAAAWHRIDDDGWRNGEMVHAALTNSMYSRFPYLDLEPWKPLLKWLTWGTEAIELVAPVALWIRRLRVPLVLSLMALHLGLELTSTIGYWQFMMLTVLWAFLSLIHI